MAQNQTRDDALRRRTPSVAELFDYHDSSAPTIHDPAHEPAPNSSAARMAKHVQYRRAAAERDREGRQLAAAAQESAEDRALETAISLINRGKSVPAETRVLAVAALQARGGSLSSAEIMAARALEV